VRDFHKQEMPLCQIKLDRQQFDIISFLAMEAIMRLSTLFTIAIILSSFTLTGCATALYNAAADNDIIKVKTLLDQGANVNEDIYGGDCPLFRAAANGNTEMVSLMLDRGANIDINLNGQTPLFWAVYKGKFDTAKYLVGRGANIDMAIIMCEGWLTPNWTDSSVPIRLRQSIALLKEWKTSRPKGKIPAVQASVIHLNDGSEIRGEIVGQSRTAVVLKTAYSTVTIEKKNIKEIKYK